MPPAFAPVVGHERLTVQMVLAECAQWSTTGTEDGQGQEEEDEQYHHDSREHLFPQAAGTEYFAMDDGDGVLVAGNRGHTDSFLCLVRR